MRGKFFYPTFFSRFIPLAVIGLILSSSVQLSAQCSRIGKVLATIPGCGVKIYDVNSGETLKAVEGYFGLTTGMTISFDAAPTALPIGCLVDNLPVVKLTCVSNQLPCSAEFNVTYDVNNPLKVVVKSIQTSTIGVSFQWNFGDGTTGSGNQVEHVFSQPGVYNICLNLSDFNTGCSSQQCKNVPVGLTNNCGYHTYVSAVGLQMLGKLSPNDNNAPPLNWVKWYVNDPTNVLSTNQLLTAPLPTYGTYLVCAEYETTDPLSGSACHATSCQTLNLGSPGTCVVSTMVDSDADCQSVNSKVCGCNGQTYDNECIAVAAGLNTWWSGGCNSLAGGSCFAELTAEVIDGNFQDGFTVKFTNQSAGNYLHTELDFGDGSPFYTEAQWTSITHHYDLPDMYRVNFTVWKDPGNVSTLTKLVATDASSLNLGNKPPTTDYVYPGDADGNLKANVQDILNIGVAYYEEGAPRRAAETGWTPQYAANWQNNIGLANLKHADSDGNGAINDLDAAVILQQYSPMDTTDVPVVPGAAKVRVELDQDTIVVNHDQPMSFEVNANIYIGSETEPALDVYGVAFALRYPEFVEHDPDFYYSSDYFGNPLQVMPLTKDIFERRQYDVGVVRKNGTAVNGYGLIGKITFKADFIVIVDIADRTEAKYLPFVIPVKELHAVDASGQPIQLSVPAQLDTLWVKVETTTGTQTPSVDQVVQVFPNPATEFTTLYTSSLSVNRIEVVNALGQLVRTETPSGNTTTRLELNGYESGLYYVRVYTENGMAQKKLVVR